MKTITRIMTLVLVLAMFACTATTAFAAEDYSVDAGYVTTNTVVCEFNPATGITYKGKTVVTVGDLFWTGTIGSAESSGTLALMKNTADCVTWTLKDGVCIIKGTPDKPANIGAGIAHNSPFWNNEHIQTIIIDANVKGIGDNTFTFGLPNLKTVVILGNKSDVVLAGETSRLGKPTRGLFPSDHDINFVLEHSRRDANGYYGGSKTDKMLISTNAHLDKWANGAAVEYDNRADYVTAAANILANAQLNQAAVDILPSDIVAAVNNNGGFRSLNGTTAPVVETTPKDNTYQCDSWAAEEVGRAFALGLADSYKSSDLRVNITRAQFAALAVNLFEKLTGKTADVPAVNPFTDTNDTDILKAYNLGIINGRGNGIFDPNANIQRQEAAAMLSRTAAAIGTPLTGDAHPFTDGIASWANADVARVYNAGVMRGIGGTNFAPTSSYTVQQTLMTLVRLNDYIGS